MFVPSQPPSTGCHCLSPHSHRPLGVTVVFVLSECRLSSWCCYFILHLVSNSMQSRGLRQIVSGALQPPCLYRNWYEILSKKYNKSPRYLLGCTWIVWLFLFLFNLFSPFLCMRLPSLVEPTHWEMFLPKLGLIFWVTLYSSLSVFTSPWQRALMAFTH